ncbi:lanthionine synthetase LanC family protein [Colwelliaceae bacterium 6441]
MSSSLKSAIENQAFINQIVKQIGASLSNVTNTTHTCGLLGGLSGDLLFLVKLSQYQPALVNENIFNNKLEYLQQQLDSQVHRPDLNTGLSGQGWFFEYINQAQGRDYDAELCEGIDEILLEALAIENWKGEIETVLGLSGIAIYAGRRQLKSAPVALFEKIVTHFEYTATQISANTQSWSQPSGSVYRFNKDHLEIPEFNLGLAHGVPGIIAAILPALKIPVLFKRTKRLLVQSCDWLLQQELAQPQNISCFSSSCNDKKGSRLGWCYGDVTIALTLARVGKALELPSYIDKARQISLHAANRDSAQGMINDAGICHGSAGLSLIFQLLNQQLNEPKLEQAANNWLLYTLALYRDKGLPGFYMYSPLTKEYQEDTSFLMGYGGIGLCLLSALGETPDWADCLLLA